MSNSCTNTIKVVPSKNSNPIIYEKSYTEAVLTLHYSKHCPGHPKGFKILKAIKRNQTIMPIFMTVCNTHRIHLEVVPVKNTKYKNNRNS